MEEKNGETYGYEADGLDGLDGLDEREFPLEEALRFRLADRMDCDSAKSRDKKERYSMTSRFG